MDAWEIVGYTHNGDVYCADCGEDVYAGMPEDTGDEATVIFASDEIPADWTCQSCDLALSDPYDRVRTTDETRG
jgi:hypothetical protein